MPADAPDSADVLAPLLTALAESLDVREIFARVSEAAAHIVPHDLLILGLLHEDGVRVRLIALSADASIAAGELAIPAPLRLAVHEDGFVLHYVRIEDRDVVAQILHEGKPPAQDVRYPVQPLFRELFAVRGLRSYARIAVRLHGGVLGGLIFCSKQPAAYGHDDIVRGRRVADCVALALAHQRLAEAEQRSVEERARAERLEAHVKRLSLALTQETRHRTLGSSPAWRDVLRHAARVAVTQATVLVTGESGTGKEVIARLIHRGSPRAEGPFVAVNCAALPENLLESELFGHEKGAFTGAQSAYAGKIEQAEGGVLFLDEVGEMSGAVQAKLLRVLEEREYQRLGSSRTQRADMRVIAATNRDLKAETANGGFREDLYYRLAVFEIALPPMRARPDDILLLADAFLEESGRTLGRPAAGLSEDVRTRLVSYAWPGNVRELRNAIERAVILCDGGTVMLEHLPPRITGATSEPAVQGNDGTLDATEREMIVAALARTGNNKSQAARLLGLTRAQLRSRIEKHRIAS
jgi:transcriptional regulator with GAF, ATPase, and Fis domain